MPLPWVFSMLVILVLLYSLFLFLNYFLFFSSVLCPTLKISEVSLPW